ncbi:MAG: hypothetical protein MJ078_03910 [Clostridia bacterium]|nr:hypothetical protein [Clostridia bacterium]
MLKQSKLPVAVTLLVQSVAFCVLFIILSVKKKSIAGAFLTVAALEGAAGYHLISELKKEVADTAVSFDDEFEVDEKAMLSDLDRSDEEKSKE